MRLTKLETKVMDALWTLGEASVREVHETLASARRPAYTTVQTIVYRLEAKHALRRVKKIGNAHVFAAVVSRSAVQRRLIEDLLGAFGGRPQPLMAHLVDSGKLTTEDLKVAEKRLRQLARSEKPS